MVQCSLNDMTIADESHLPLLSDSLTDHLLIST